ncbi:glutaredoxin-like YruB-family protein [Bacillus ectoiniformans]|uniref:glutaredoxin family protein n=1 Tax=Bacillus ectoiniformans TaxID=1494429 RepID=UPI0019563668|nr:glutaredoxin family protein [Bacillus ectoiniformans]MBM7647469.1 glutaredoxin-like YruB-family protein [Bacillus ectoiniformans]
MNSITVYTTTRCPYCVMLKNYLSEQGLPYKEVNVERDPGLMQKLVNTTGQMGVPQTEVNGKWVIGYDPASIMSAMK